MEWIFYSNIVGLYLSGKASASNPFGMTKVSPTHSLYDPASAEMLLRCIYVGHKYPHIYTLSITTGKIRVWKYVVHYTFQHMSTITKLSQDVTQYYKNITSLKGANVRI